MPALLFRPAFDSGVPVPALELDMCSFGVRVPALAGSAEHLTSHEQDVRRAFGEAADVPAVPRRPVRD